MNHTNCDYLMENYDYYQHNYNEIDESIMQNGVVHQTLFLGIDDDTELKNPCEIPFIEIEGRMSLAHENLTQIPKQIADKFAEKIQILDLSHNSLKNLNFLANFRNLTTLVLDKNDEPIVNTLPHLRALEILWLNNCKIRNTIAWINRIQFCCPKLKQLSLLGNPGTLSTFNGNTISEHTDYRMFALNMLPKLEWLDNSEITQSQRCQADENREKYTGNSQHLLRLHQRLSSTPWFTNIIPSNKQEKNQSTYTN